MEIREKIVNRLITTPLVDSKGRNVIISQAVFSKILDGICTFCGNKIEDQMFITTFQFKAYQNSGCCSRCASRLHSTLTKEAVEKIMKIDI